MLNKQKLLKEIFKKTKYIENFFYGQFLDLNTEKKYSQVSNNNNKYKNLGIGILIIIFQTSFATLMNYNIGKIYIKFLIIFIINILLNGIFLIISFRMNNENIKLRMKIDWIKYFIQLFSLYFMCIVLSLKLLENKMYIFSASIVFSYIFISTQICILKYHSKFISYITFIGFIIIMFFDYFHSKKLVITIDKRLDICMSFYCSKIDSSLNIDYNSINPIS